MKNKHKHKNWIDSSLIKPSNETIDMKKIGLSSILTTVILSSVFSCANAQNQPTNYKFIVNNNFQPVQNDKLAVVQHNSCDNKDSNQYWTINPGQSSGLSWDSGYCSTYNPPFVGQVTLTGKDGSTATIVEKIDAAGIIRVQKDCSLNGNLNCNNVSIRPSGTQVIVDLNLNS